MGYLSALKKKYEKTDWNISSYINISLMDFIDNHMGDATHPIF